MQSSSLSGVPVSELSLLTQLADQIIHAAQTEQLFNFIEKQQPTDLPAMELVSEQSLEQQTETSARLPILSGISYKQQSLRMRSRPMSIAGVRMADSNVFYVNRDSQTVTSNKPMLFFEPPVVSSPPVEMRSVAPVRSASWEETANLRKASMKLEAVKLQSLTESNLRQAAQIVNSQTTATVLPVERPQHFNPPKFPLRGNAGKMTFTKLARAHDPSTLHALVEEQRNRDAQRITAQNRVFRPARESKFPEAIRTIKSVYAKLSQKSQAFVHYFRRLKKLEKEFFMVSR